MRLGSNTVHMLRRFDDSGLVYPIIRDSNHGWIQPHVLEDKFCKLSSIAKMQIKLRDDVVSTPYWFCEDNWSVVGKTPQGAITKQNPSQWTFGLDDDVISYIRSYGGFFLFPLPLSDQKATYYDMDPPFIYNPRWKNVSTTEGSTTVAARACECNNVTAIAMSVFIYAPIRVNHALSDNLLRMWMPYSVNGGNTEIRTLGLKLDKTAGTTYASPYIAAQGLLYENRVTFQYKSSVRVYAPVIQMWNGTTMWTSSYDTTTPITVEVRLQVKTVND